MTDVSALPPLSSGGSPASAPADPAAASVAPAGPAAPTAGTAGPTPKSPSSPNFGSQLVRALELGLVTALGTFSASPVATSGNITWRNYAAAGIAAGFAGLWSVARALGYNQASSN